MRRFRSVSRTVAVAGRSGFSLIEVMVAMTILAVIVVMTAVVFQQSSLAWRRGTRSAEGNMTLRALIGVIQRELTQAVDAREFWEDDQVHPQIHFDVTPSTVQFVILASDVENASTRAPRLILYSYAGGGLTRVETEIEVNGGRWRTRSPGPPIVLNAAEKMEFSRFEFRTPPGYANNNREMPEYVTIAASVSREGDVSSLGAWSWGPDLADTDRDSDPPPRYRSW